ncbi:MAG: hypothetical protein WC810_24490 [Janthinobacterium sp.]|jgi:hypothetical protein
MILGEIEAFINIAEKLKKYIPFLKPATKQESVAARFIRLFETHGVHRNQIPRFFGHGLTLNDLKSEDSLFPNLNEKMLDDACQLFAVRREWLDGADEIAHTNHDFYKHPEEFQTFITELKMANPEGHLQGELFSPEKPDVKSQAIIVLNEIVGWIGNEPIYRYHLCNNWSYSYWKARAYLTACIAIALKHDVHIMGTSGAKKKIDLLAQGDILLASEEKGIPSIYGPKWYPEDMALVPEVYLKGIDPEIENFGVRAGLSLWLELEEQGLMKTGLGKEARTLFEQEQRIWLSVQ